MTRKIITTVIVLIIVFSLILGGIYAMNSEKYHFVLSDKYLVELKDKWELCSDTSAEFLIPKDAPKKLHLCFESCYFASELSIDGESILHTYNSIEDSTSVFTYWVEIPDSSAGKVLKLEAYSPKALNSITSAHSAIGSHYSLFMFFIGRNLYVILFSIFCIVIVIIVLIGGWWLNSIGINLDDIDFWAFSFFVLLSGTYIFSESQFVSLLEGYYSLFALLNFVSTCMIPVALAAFQYRFYPIIRKQLNTFCGLIIAVFLITVVLWMSGIISIYSSLTVFHIFTVVSILMLVIATFTSHFDTSDYKILGVANLIFVTSSVVMLVYYYLNQSGYYNVLYSASIFVYINLLLIGAMLRIYRNTYFQEMSKRNALRTAVSDAEAANRAKTVFLLSMSHDVRTPMNAIMGYSRIAKKNADNPQIVMDCLDKVEKSGEHLIGLITEVLEMSRLENRRVQLNCEPVNLIELFDSATDIIRQNADEKSISVIADRNGINHPIVLADSVRLESILLNIAGNSIKYTGKGGTIHCRLSESDISDTSATYTLTVTDNGIGMSKETADAMFDAFERGEESRAAGIQGTGLGMSITKAYVELMNGKINVESDLGKGTAITVSIEFQLADSAPVIESADADLDEDISGLKVLLVEDNALNREIALDMLSDFGISADVAEDGAAAVDILSGTAVQKYDVILMDILMPVMDGYEATRAIRAMNSNVSEIPVIAMTANAFEENIRLEKEAGMDYHINKPVNPDELKKAIVSVLKIMRDND